MQKRDEIRKHKVPGKSYPVYYIVPSKLNDIGGMAREFSSEIFWKIEKFPHLPQKNSESPEEYFLKRLIHLYGLYALYVIIKSWKFSSDKNSRARNIENMNEWLRQTLPMSKDSYLFSEGIRDLVWSENFYDISLICDSKEKSAKLVELEKTLEKMYPDQVRFFEEMMGGLEEKAKGTKKWIEGSLRRKAPTKRHARRY